MSIDNILQIILITYNRKKHLQKTFEQIFASNSPIRNYPITILDNASTDGTSELIQEYCKNFPNITHIKHKRNIGGNANIARAFESASKEYLWILCDDDFYNWDNWNELEQAILSNNYDMLFTCTQLIRDKKDISQLTHQATFIPGVIYASKRITDDIMQNIHNTINTMFCQTMLSTDIICNTPEKIFVPNKDIVLRIPNGEEEDKTVIRGRIESTVHPDTKNVFWHIGFIQAIQVINDKKKRDYIVEHTRFTDIFTQSFFSYMVFIVEYNHLNKKGNLKNIANLFFNINFTQKITLIFAFLTYHLIYRFIYFYKTSSGIYVRLFNKLKTKIFSFKRTKQNHTT